MKLHEIIKKISVEQSKQGYVDTLVKIGIHYGQADFYVRMAILGEEKPWRECNEGEKKASVLMDEICDLVSKAVRKNWESIHERILTLE